VLLAYSLHAVMIRLTSLLERLYMIYWYLWYLESVLKCQGLVTGLDKPLQMLYTSVTIRNQTE
jgi:hypothetical protein